MKRLSVVVIAASVAPPLLINVLPISVLALAVITPPL